MGRRPTIRELSRARARYEAAVNAVLACEGTVVADQRDDVALLSDAIEVLHKMHLMHLAYIQFADLRFRGAVADIDELKRRVFQLEKRLDSLGKGVRDPSV